uniref:Predicted nucleic acid-binding protein, contains PIN domain n=1 Tax=Candidatus Kentrum sp. FM TaxID=2126340 RepID=A0A450WS76_9GAMM|nr:MAG: Predicted nucleic acid-binding protein, contains PIN domain [Candidatus Kentron sp. FM]VFJ72442.1 MAG: Predicted nucleic acid-binding protein, contains PIN domain [Candidatus Kentron sp. FM]VFK19879.1 MAG: Predicted nucleic acid-binding protein, contains PIN domain [Candidatus Kentron sp. FM]
MKVYADTSVFGGVFDEEFAEDSRRFFDDLKAGKFELVVSALVEEEIESAPRQVRAHFDEVSSFAEIAGIGPKVLDLRDAYLAAGIVTRKSVSDATHVALATISGCEMIVSWNFKHIVHFQKIPKYNAVNTLSGYHCINIYPPSSMISYDES